MKCLSIYTVALALLAGSAVARTKLVTLPERDKVVLNMENQNHALLYEERVIPLQQGTNMIDFAWNGVSIDSDSVLLELLDQPEGEDQQVMVIATSYPPNEQALTWELYSPSARPQLMRVSYLLHGISKEVSYEMMVNEDETNASFKQRLLLKNQSGEDLEDAVLRLSYSNELTRSVQSGEARRFTTIEEAEVPLEKLYVSRPHGFQNDLDKSETVGLVYRLVNNEKLVSNPSVLDFGKTRIFGDDGMGSSILLGESYLMKTPPNEDADLTIGTVKDVSVKRRLISDNRINQRRNDSGRVVLYDKEVVLGYELENFKEEPVTLTLHELVNGDWDVFSVTGGDADTERVSNTELKVTFKLPAAEAGKEPEKIKVELKMFYRNRFPNEN